VNFARARSSDMATPCLLATILVATLAVAAAPEVAQELVEAEGFGERVLHGCDRDRPEFSHVRGQPLVSGVKGKSGLTHLHIVWSLGQVLLAADCVDAFEVEFQQVGGGRLAWSQWSGMVSSVKTFEKEYCSIQNPN